MARATAAPTRAISIKQPFVEQILIGKKRREYRSQPTRIHERVFIYASRTVRTEPAEWKKARCSPDDVPTGAIVGTVEIVGCVPDGDGYAYLLRAPKRFAKPRRPKNHPQPRFWIPRF